MHYLQICYPLNIDNTHIHRGLSKIFNSIIFLSTQIRQNCSTYDSPYIVSDIGTAYSRPNRRSVMCARARLVYRHLILILILIVLPNAAT